MGITDGLGGEEVNQTTNVQTATVSGTTLYGTTISGVDIIGTTTVYGATISGLKVQTGSLTAPDISCSSVISGTNLAIRGSSLTATAVSNTNGALTSVGIGSNAYAGKIRAGSSALGAGSNAWVVFYPAFTGVPAVVTQDTTTADKALLVKAGSVGIGSFYVEGPTASDAFNWIAVGL